MTNCRDIRYCVVELLHKNNVNIEAKDKQEVIGILVQYVEHLIFNMVAVACLISLTLGIKKLVKEHMQHLEGYITKRCRLSVKSRKMNGGSAFNTAAFYGIPEPRYSISNAGNDIMNIDWNNNTARPMLASTMTGGKGKYKLTRTSCNKLYKVISKEIYKVFLFFKVKSTKEARDEFIKLFNTFIHELFAKFGKKKVLTAKSALDIVKKSNLADALKEWKK